MSFEQFLRASTHWSGVMLRAVWWVKKCATTESLATEWEQPLTGHWFSEWTGRLRSLSKASEQKVPFSRA